MLPQFAVSIDVTLATPIAMTVCILVIPAGLARRIIAAWTHQLRSWFVHAMSDAPNLRPATNDEVSEALAHALRFDGRKRFHQADQHQARIAADHLLKCLLQSGFVLMRKPPTPMHSDAAHRRPYPLTD